MVQDRDIVNCYYRSLIEIQHMAYQIAAILSVLCKQDFLY